MKIAWVLVTAVALIVTVGAQNGFAQFSGRDILDNICKNVSRGRRSDESDNRQKKRSRLDRPATDSYEQTEHELALLEADLQLQSQQIEPWRWFAGKVSDYAGELSRERARMDVRGPAEAPSGGLQHFKQLTEAARTRLSRLEDIQSAANKLYATLSPDQKKIADSRIVTMLASFPTEVSAGDGGSSDRNLDSANKTRR